jgi:transcriptional regulator with PAS, ATPase and Fis domain
MENLNSIKQRFGIVGNDSKLNQALERAIQVAPTDISVLVSGESGVGKEFIPKIIHAYSARKHNQYIAINCGAIPEGTIDSELFGHEKGAFTGALNARKGYFEVADGGTVFLDEVGELPTATQIRLLRILESGEFIKVGSSAVQKTNVRIVAATNVKMMEAIQKSRFREDLYYRLNTIEIKLPTLRERKEDVPFVFTKFLNEFAEKYRRPPISLDPEAMQFLKNYAWPGNIRQLKNFAEQLSVIEIGREIGLDRIKSFFGQDSNLAIIVKENNGDSSEFSSERDILYRVLFDMKRDLTDLKKITLELINQKDQNSETIADKEVYRRLFNEPKEINTHATNFSTFTHKIEPSKEKIIEVTPEEPIQESIKLSSEEGSLSLHEKEIEMIQIALQKNKGKRNRAAKELGISERTLYRKIKQFDL